MKIPNASFKIEKSTPELSANFFSKLGDGQPRLFYSVTLLFFKLLLGLRSIYSLEFLLINSFLEFHGMVTDIHVKVGDNLDLISD